VIDEMVSDGTTVLLTTQYLEEADRHAGRIVVIDDGKIIAEGTAAQLKATLGVTIVEVRLPDPASARQVTRELSWIGTAGVLDDERTVTVTVADPGPAVLQVTRSFDALELVPDQIAIREPTLDEAFLQLTGHTRGTPAAATDQRVPQLSEEGIRT